MKQLLNFFILFLYFIFILFIFGIAVELMARYLRPQLLHPLQEREKFCQHDSEIGWINKPLVSGRMKTDDFDVAVRINSRGMRDKEYSYTKSEGKFRIAVLGDSFVWGYGVEEPQIFVKKLEVLFPQIEVLNFGCSGYGQDQELLLQKRDVLRYHPDLILVNVHVASDIENNASFFQYGFYKPLFKSEGHQMVLENVPVAAHTFGTRLNTWLMSRSVAWRLLGSRKIRNLDFVSVWVALMDRNPELLKMAWNNIPPVDLTCALCHELQRSASGSGSKILFVLSSNLPLPAGGRQNAPLLKDEAYLRLQHCLQTHQLEVLDLMPFFQDHLQRHPETALTFTHDAHWNEKGHQAAADAIKDYLLSNTEWETKIRP